MKSETRPTVFLVDDDALYLKALEVEFLQRTDFIVKTFGTAESCISRLSEEPNLIILDYHLDGIDKHAMNGLNALKKIKSINQDIPVVMLSSQDKIEVAISCMHHRAFDYVVKSETTFVRLKKIIEVLLRYEKLEKQFG
ncbi:MAG: response regulator [Cytophagales bacterium]|nr:response regulator [Cytophagales bacterium]